MCPVAAAEWASLQAVHFASNTRGKRRLSSPASLGLCALLSDEKYYRIWVQKYYRIGKILARPEEASSAVSETMSSTAGACWEFA